MEVFVGFVQKGLIGAFVAMQRSKIRFQMGLKLRMGEKSMRDVLAYEDRGPLTSGAKH